MRRMLEALALVLVCCCSQSHSSTTFKFAELLTSGNVREPVDFTINFQTTRIIYPSEKIGIIMPRFTQRLRDYQKAPNNVSFSDLLISPSTYFRAKWLEGFNVHGDTVPYPSPLLVLETKNNATLVAGSYVTFKVFKDNGIGAVCGFAGSEFVSQNSSLVYPSKPFQMVTVVPELFSFTETVLLITTTYDYLGAVVSNTSVITPYLRSRNITLFNNDSLDFTTYSGIGSGCATFANCTNHGQCDYCYESCRCFPGWGATGDLFMTGAVPANDCSHRVCPAGRAFTDLPTAANQAHALAECSNQGICNRTTGLCQCFTPFAGSACERMECPNNCSNRGRCDSLADIARFVSLKEPQRPEVVYGSGMGMNTVAWDFQTTHGCQCDSAWPVGFDTGERQLAEYFGADCSLRHCPSGDDPFTSTNELDCTGKSQVDSGRTGRSGNLCHVDCSNRGICDYKTGTCACFPGSWGEACDRFTNAGME